MKYPEYSNLLFIITDINPKCNCFFKEISVNPKTKHNPYASAVSSGSVVSSGSTGAVCTGLSIILLSLT